MGNDETYARWKGWGHPEITTSAERSIWDQLHSFVSLKSGTRLLEIGFGQGSHLLYCQSKGAQVTGVETNKTGYEIAKSNRLKVHLGTVGEAIQGQTFDSVIAMDVIEHISLDQVIDLFKVVRESLIEGGTFLLTFPNGGSPFGRIHQHGDLTHNHAYNRFSMEQLGVLSDLKVIRFCDFPEYFDLSSPIKLGKHLVRLVFRWILKILFRSYSSEPLGLSVVCVFQKAPLSKPS